MSMETSVEISLYPLGREYIPEIKAFLDHLKGYGDLDVQVNGMSTQIFGDYRTIMNVLTDEIERSFKEKGKSVFVLKIVNGHLKKEQ